MLTRRSLVETPPYMCISYLISFSIIQLCLKTITHLFFYLQLHDVCSRYLWLSLPNHLTKKDVPCETDQLTHAYTFILHPPTSSTWKPKVCLSSCQKLQGKVGDSNETNLVNYYSANSVRYCLIVTGI